MNDGLYIIGTYVSNDTKKQELFANLVDAVNATLPDHGLTDCFYPPAENDTGLIYILESTGYKKNPDIKLKSHKGIFDTMHYSTAPIERVQATALKRHFRDMSGVEWEFIDDTNAPLTIQDITGNDLSIEALRLRTRFATSTPVKDLIHLHQFFNQEAPKHIAEPTVPQLIYFPLSWARQFHLKRVDDGIRAIQTYTREIS